MYLAIGGAGAPLDDVGSSATLVTSASAHHWLEIECGETSLACTVRGLDGSVMDEFQVLVPVANDAMTWSDVKKAFR